LSKPPELLSAFLSHNNTKEEREKPHVENATIKTIAYNSVDGKYSFLLNQHLD
jgi:hypothetical protein